MTGILVFVTAIWLAPSRAAAQADPNPGSLTFTGTTDFSNAYMFRGLRQDDTALIIWPAADLGISIYEGTGGLRSVALNVGSWNSLHTGDTGSDGPSGKLWYESDFYSTLSFGLPYGVSLGGTYTAYTSPNNAFSTVKEIAFRVALDDSASTFSVRPYALLALEFDTSPGFGQADGGLNAGRYLELGVAPTFGTELAALSVPVKVGLSVGDYYELAGEDNKFGFFSVGVAASVPLGSTTRFGTWSARGGAEFLSLGDTPEAFNGGDQSKLVFSIGIGLVY
jgi:hypothetical protein